MLTALEILEAHPTSRPVPHHWDHTQAELSVQTAKHSPIGSLSFRSAALSGVTRVIRLVSQRMNVLYCDLVYICVS